MDAKDFDFVRFREYKAEREEKARAFLAGKGGPILLQERVIANYVICRTPQESLACQLDAITENMRCQSGYVPFLEPWFGVGVFANAFGCEYVWFDNAAPQTHYSVFNEEQAAKLTKPDLSASSAMKLVMEGIDYFLHETRGEIPISATDTQSPLDTSTLIWEINNFFETMFVNPEVVHHVMNLVTETIIEFSKQQSEKIGKPWAQPGHLMLSAAGGPGLSISDDNIVMVSPETYTEFVVPYNERIAAAFGGLAVHSCGNFERQLPALLKTKGLLVVDGAFSPVMDPAPNTQYEQFRDAMKGSGIILQPRLHLDWPETLARLYHPDMLLAPVVPPPAKNEPADKNLRLLEKII